MGTDDSGDLRWATIDSFVGNHASPALTMYRPCPVCGLDRPRLVLELTDFQMFSDSATEPKRLDVRQVACRRCFTHYMNPVYTPYGFQILFAEAGRSYGSGEGRPAEQVDWLDARGLLDEGRSLLDIGCYEGGFLERLPAGVAAMGVEVDAAAVERGRERLAGRDAELICGDFATFEIDSTPDVMTMFHVLEHVTDPVAVLRKLRSLAHDDSRLVVEVPVLERAVTNDIGGFFTTQHVTHFSRSTLAACLRRAGWETLEKYGADELDYNACRVLAAPSADELDARHVVGDPLDLYASSRSLESWHRAGRDVSTRLGKVGEGRRCVLWGAGTHLENLYQRTSLFADSWRLFSIVDSDVTKHGSTWRGIPVQAPSTLTSIADDDAVPGGVSSDGHESEITAAAVELGVPRERIIELYESVTVY
jgi:2-polyprenyl-3-methyl-5-hydroxy-6-metoxy-1,4-benzoquinol methylase